ncbi:uncharacterized protein SPAPADRAFT_148071 [Spathaspora passalidarum NRRL Y-27907]|uniref:Uncharacterized protein n=1 Tax=Spathaspora passalidarum (strain NRRL Y-27907 / 11-Y1) TaxID=619300 RepID=G3AJI1_SPAPN|nr:uncharacterized protein SPAPADRAFT_148071 [Spathaspora passalidarum NRRL Y-27907]EGW33884.1 hypothetical protein SPAPADRAFT_148071 [Spathaspora passalidarum NRRL Y-27907]
MSSNGAKVLAIVFAGAVSWYTGVKFWKPIVVESLEKRGMLRDDIDIGYVDRDQPESWKDVVDKYKEFVHPNAQDPNEPKKE